MGIPGLFAWLRKNCPFTIRKLPSQRSMPMEVKQDIDNLLLDMNGIYHEACQKVYKYGNYTELKSKIHTEVPLPPPNVMRKRVFQEIGKIMDQLVYRIRPTKRVLIMVDGPAGNAKQSQQRQRRYRSVHDPDRKFDSNCISPGTEWMDYLSKYLDQYIRKQVTHSGLWRGLTVVFSNEKVPGEGEHKLIRFIREYGVKGENYVLYGLDADLIMLCLSIQNTLSVISGDPVTPPKFWIFRKDQYTDADLIVDIAGLRQFLIEELTWGLECDRTSLINDFIFLCFLLGNDFLPHSPTIDLVEGGVELLFRAYSDACEKGSRHLIINDQLCPSVLKDILYSISLQEKILLEDSVRKAEKFADPLLQKYIVMVDAAPSERPVEEIIIDLTSPSSPKESIEESVKKPTVEDTVSTLKKVPLLRFEAYRDEYYRVKFPDHTRTEVCHEFFRGMEWVYKYYTYGIPSWTWNYPFFYSPFAKEMVEALDSYISKPFSMGRPMDLFKQLISILPPQSKDLLPAPLQPLIEKFPSEVKVDVAGKKFDWQGVVLVPPLPVFEKEYRAIMDSMDMSEKRRSFLGKEYIYKYRPDVQYQHKTYYGNFQCSTEVKVLA